MLNEPYLPRPGIDERAVVKEMLRDQHSAHWEECRNFVKHCVYAKNIPDSLHEDIIQEVMYKVTKSLERFRFECTLKAWINIIVEHCIADAHRGRRNEVAYHFHLALSPNESDYEGEEPGASEVKSAEEAFMTDDEIRNGWAACLEYASTHAHPIRNQLIIWMVIHEGKTHAEAARAAGCAEPVVGYVVREAQRYARKMRDQK